MLISIGWSVSEGGMVGLAGCVGVSGKEEREFVARYKTFKTEKVSQFDCL